MEFITAAAIHEMVDFDILIEALEQAHKGAPPLQNRHIMEAPRGAGPPDIFLNLPAWQPGEGIGVKLVTSFPGNRQLGRPTVNAAYVWFDGTTGAPDAVMDGEALTFRKTAADSALGAKMLAREDVSTMLMIGAGALAPHLVLAHRTVRPSIERVLIWNRTSENAHEMASSLQAEHGIDAVVITDLRTGLRGADLVSSATMTPTPLVLGEELKAGTHVDLVGSFTPEMRESDDEALRRSAVYVDSFETALESGDLSDPLTRGIISRNDVLGDMYDLCQGSIPRRLSDTQITLMKNGGGGHLDYYTAREIMRRWRRRPAKMPPHPGEGRQN